MKKGIALVLVLMCCAWVALPALAEEAPAFDYTLLEGKDGYEYDKFDKTWHYVGLYIDPASSLILAFDITGANNTLQVPPMLMIVSEGLEPKSMDILIGETLATIDLDVVEGGTSEDSASIYLGSNEVDLLRALVDAKEFSVRIVGKEKKVTFDIGKEEYVSNIEAVLETIVQYQLWDDTNWSDTARSIYKYYTDTYKYCTDTSTPFTFH